MHHVALFLIAGAISVAITMLVKIIATRHGILDIPSVSRKVHKKGTPLLGGFAIFVTFFALLGVLRFWYPDLFSRIPDGVLLAVGIASSVLMIGGFIDDRFTLPAQAQIIFPIVAAAIAVGGGIRVSEVTNPFGGTIVLGAGAALIVAFLWLMGMMYTTKLLDGLDGLATGVVLIGSLMIFALTQTDQFFQPDVGTMAMIFAGALFGFLLLNFYPAKIFLGEGGSVFIGFLLGVLAIISGSKIATTLLVVGIPALDVAWVIIARLRRRRSVLKGDDLHLHYRFLQKGFSHRSTVLLIYVLAASFGVTTLVLESKQKLIALGILVIVMIGIGSYLVWGSSERKNR